MRQLTGRGVLFWLGGFFAVVIAANVWFVTLSIASFHGEDRVRPYQQGLNFNDTLEARARQRALGWRVAIELADGSRLYVAIVDRDGAPVPDLRLSGLLRHPADTFRDHPLSLREVSPGRYEASIGQAGKGWRDAVIRSADGNSFEAERRLWLP